MVVIGWKCALVVLDVLVIGLEELKWLGHARHRSGGGLDDGGELGEGQFRILLIFTYDTRDQFFNLFLQVPIFEALR